MTNEDPWATAPQEVAATAAPKYDYEPPVVAPKVGEVVQTVKFGTAFDAPWLVTHGPDAATVNAIVKARDFTDLIDNTVTITRYAQGKWSGTKTTPDAAPRSQPDRTGAPNGEKKYCAHGERDYKEGVSKAGKTYKGYFCTSGDKDNQCSPEWAK